jgi:hypothetical protein
MTTIELNQAAILTGQMNPTPNSWGSINTFFVTHFISGLLNAPIELKVV